MNKYYKVKGQFTVTFNYEYDVVAKDKVDAEMRATARARKDIKYYYSIGLQGRPVTLRIGEYQKISHFNSPSQILVVTEGEETPLPETTIPRPDVQLTGTCKYCMEPIPEGSYCCKSCWDEFDRDENDEDDEFDYERDE